MRGDIHSPPDSSGARVWVFYDGDCGVCSRAVSWALANDRDGRLRAEPVQSAAAHARLGTLAGGAALDELHVWSEARGLATGIDAVSVVLTQLPGGARWADWLLRPNVRPHAARLYRWFADRRLLFGATACDTDSRRR